MKLFLSSALTRLALTPTAREASLHVHNAGRRV